MKGLVPGLKTILWPVPPALAAVVNTQRAIYNPSILTVAGNGVVDYAVNLATLPTCNSTYWQDADATDATKYIQSGGAAGHPTDLTHQFGIAPYLPIAFAAA
jgi:hypothetical protein